MLILINADVVVRVIDHSVSDHQSTVIYSREQLYIVQ